MKYWYASSLKSLGVEENFDADAENVFRGRVVSITQNSKGLILQVEDLNSYKESKKKISVKVSHSLNYFPFSFPFFKGVCVEFRFTDENIEKDKNNRFLGFCIPIQELKISANFGNENEIRLDKRFVYVEKAKTFLPAFGDKKVNKDNELKKSIINSLLNIFLIVPNTTESQGEYDFLAHLHPHVWNSIIKERASFKNADSIAKAIEHLPKGINCICLICGGGNHMKIFCKKIIKDALQKVREQNKDIYIVSGLGHSNDNRKICFSDLLDYNANIPKDAAVYLNGLFGKTYQN